MKTIAICSQKGGVGKSTTAVTMAYELNERGHKTLLIDMDAQGNSSDTMRATLGDNPSMYEVIMDPSIMVAKAVQRCEFGDVIPGKHALRDLEAEARSEGISVYILKEKLEAVSRYYEYCVIDTPPNLGFALYAALIAADDIIIPMIADRYSIQGLLELYETIVLVKEETNLNPNINLAGILLTKHSDRMVYARQVREFLEGYAKDMGTKVFKRAIRETIRVRESQTAKIPLPKYEPYGTATMDYRSFVSEFLGGE